MKGLDSPARHTKENGMTKLTKESDMKYETKEAASLDRAVSEIETYLGAFGMSWLL